VSEREVGIEGRIEEFFGRMVELLDWELDAEVGRSEDGSLRVDLSGPDGELFLQNRAELLDAVQYLANRAFARELDQERIQVDCDGFRERKETELREIARRVSERVRLTGDEVELGLMNPYERRIVHLEVAETEGVTTTSMGHGVMKRVVIHPT
jgi:spoIIIJ-associated protein